MIRILLLSDTHLGLDSPARPRVEQRRRGDDFWANFERVLAFARRERPDALVHGGDVFFRSRLPTSLVERVWAPLRALADEGLPLFLVPGNHERSALPRTLLSSHPRIHVFDAPRTFVPVLQGTPVSLSGFPFHARAGAELERLLGETGWAGARAALKLLCLHQAVEGAQVGPADFTFRDAPDVVRARQLPRGLSAVLCGHIHRHQVLRHAVPVFYPGSIERTSFAERAEDKGFLLLGFTRTGTAWQVEHTFHPLPARPMFEVMLGARAPDPEGDLRARLARLPADAIVRVRTGGQLPPGLTAARLRALAPPSMNVSWADVRAWPR